MAKYLTEAIGTFFLVLTICLAVQFAGNLAPLAIGSSLMVMVYMGGHVSGAHYNPAVSLAVLLRGKLAPSDFAPYLIAQFAGAIAAAGVALFVTGKTLEVAPGKDVSIAAALVVEVLYTFALALVVLNVATSSKTANNSFYGLAIGFTVVVAAFAAGGISGGAFNPAVGVGANAVHAFHQSNWNQLHTWIYLAGPLAGGALAAGVFQLQEGKS